jgi:hypothetical protein
MARTFLDIAHRAHDRARKRNRLDRIYDKISLGEFVAKRNRLQAAFDKRWNAITGCNLDGLRGADLALVGRAAA